MPADQTSAGKSAKPYPLDIWTCEGCYAASWGHHDPLTFLAALASEYRIYVPVGTRVWRGYARLGFDGAEGKRCVYHTAGPGRGVRPITEAEWH